MNPTMSADCLRHPAAGSSLPAEARELEADVSDAIEKGVAPAAAPGRQERWVAANRTALQSSNAFIERHGLPLARYRNF